MQVSTGSNLTSLIPFRISDSILGLNKKRLFLFVLLVMFVLAVSLWSLQNNILFSGYDDKMVHQKHLSPDLYNQNSAPNKTSETSEDPDASPAAFPSVLSTGRENHTTTVLS